MATVATTPRTNRFTLATTSAGPFLVGFRLFASDGLDVHVDAVRQTSGFTVNATFVDGYDDNATVTFVSSLPPGTVVQFDGALRPGRSADYANPDPLLTAKINSELARLWSSVSEINQLVRRSVRALDPLEAVDGIDASDLSDLPANLAAAADAASAASAAALEATTARDEVVLIQDTLPDPKGAWLTATAYERGDIVTEDGSSYICLLDHTSGSFAADLSALRWQLLAQKGAAGAGSGDMIGSNNLSELTNKPLALATLGGQAADNDLTALAGLSSTGLVVRSGAGSAAVRTLSAGARISITDPDGVSGNPAIAATDDHNRIINGNFAIWQRGTSASADNAYAADKWMNNFLGGTMSYSRQSFTIGDKLGRNTPQFFARATAAGGAGSTDFALLQQGIEDARTFAGETITVLGWAKRSGGSGNMSIGGWQNFGFGGSPSPNEPVPGQQVVLTTSWAPFAVQIAVPSVTGKVFGTTEDRGFLALGAWLSAGSAFATHTASLGQQTVTVDLWGLHILPGAHGVGAASLYLEPEYGPELRRCQRYFEVGEASQFYPSSSNRYLYVPFKVSKWITPTIIRTGDGLLSSGTAGTISAYARTHGFYWFQAGPTTVLGGDWTAEADV